MGSTVSRIWQRTERETGIRDLDMDILIEIASKLDVYDAAKMAMTCNRLKEAAGSYPDLKSRELCLARRQLKFSDCMDKVDYLPPIPLRKKEAFTQILICDAKTILVVHGSHIYRYRIRDSEIWKFKVFDCADVRAQIHCTRLYGNENEVVVSSSYDNNIRVWGNGALQLTLRGRSGPSTVLADSLLAVAGDGNPPVLAGGGRHGIVHLWSLGLPSDNTGGQSSPIARLRVTGRRLDSQNVVELAVAKHNSSLLVSLARDSKLVVWDATSESCVGSISGIEEEDGGGVHVPVGIRCREGEAVCYVACGSSVTAMDLRSMQTVATVAAHVPDLDDHVPGPGIAAFEVHRWSPLICTGGSDKKAKLWDIRASRSNHPTPMAVLRKHRAAVKHIHLDYSKIVTGTCGDTKVHVWDTKTAKRLVSLDCNHSDHSSFGLNGMAVKGTSIVTATCPPNCNPTSHPKVIRFRDYSNSNQPL